MKLRLQTIAGMVDPGKTVADIGTDHGFLPIELVKSGKTPSAIAVDITEGPLERARDHIRQAGLSDRIECRISDGFDRLGIHEADIAVIAGMGGDLIADIISRKPDAVKELIVSPHTHCEKVRYELRRNCFKIIDERMIVESGKYYVVIKAVKDRSCSCEGALVYDYFGPVLIERKDRVLRQFLYAESEKFGSIVQKRDYLRLVQEALSAMR